MPRAVVARLKSTRISIPAAGTLEQYKEIVCALFEDMSSLQLVDYSKLLQLFNDRNIPVDGLDPSLDALLHTGILTPSQAPALRSGNEFGNVGDAESTLVECKMARLVEANMKTIVAIIWVLEIASEAPEPGEPKFNSFERELNIESWRGFSSINKLFSQVFVTWAPCLDASIIVGSLRGPNDSPYEGGIFHFQIEKNEGYPHSTPLFCFLTPVYHPNVGSSGELHSAVRRTKWDRTGTITSFLGSIISLLQDPDITYPINLEASALYLNDRDAYDVQVKEWTRIFGTVGGRLIVLDDFPHYQRLITRQITSTGSA